MGWGTSRHVTVQALVEGVVEAAGLECTVDCIGTRCTWYGEAPAGVILGQSMLVTLSASLRACAVCDGKMREESSRELTFLRRHMTSACDFSKVAKSRSAIAIAD